MIATGTAVTTAVVDAATALVACGVWASTVEAAAPIENASAAARIGSVRVIGIP
jgi:hypothetical protein